MRKDLLSIDDLTAEEARELLSLAGRLKSGAAEHSLPGKTLALVFEKPSLRTRVTFEVGMTQLGGHAIYLSMQDIGLGQRESVSDVAQNLSRWVDGIAARTFAHQSAVELGEHSSIPVINALSDHEHPCQALADVLTLQERSKGLSGLSLAYVGDGNNVCHSLLLLAALLGMDMRVATPTSYEPNAGVLERAKALAEQSGGSVLLTDDPALAVAQADAVYTDVWASMGDEHEAEARAEVFRPYQVNSALFGLAKPTAVAMHCLPAHRGDEITGEVLDGPHSVVLDQAENRLHAQKAVLVSLLGG
ncbi:MAG: ornithine carbamoyltransferase [Armatimonadetes bacterium CG_4_10_14_3_um_filter_66_18]|nr:ornithine carbamoyltransferase [Armatimonadota bacterium]OIO93454.1 MAG: ornithine carbamoyltransferase [Armatimonadetes bacterium CG2_30_66_41]PIU94042.1 MAG: ornithine carbamoyltransferase [Armatimonadetes bacterium CG06_land_8_20_14_3_00_66_21]PIX43102.1 MAG: ornithine carbamoyltransferase [Armatimonadetes bacterium CG_4_8_14_3_um_filter_66_20]PIY36178.1 MAG: ornithine carbamoyltransferase [Armatimonadetes bacterium CG_4_10_14_3_um_filter_66_18]PIZ50361.1 MAG: ornithine carbamoyltransfer